MGEFYSYRRYLTTTTTVLNCCGVDLQNKNKLSCCQHPPLNEKAYYFFLLMKYYVKCNYHRTHLNV